MFYRANNPFINAMFTDRSKFCKQVFKRVTQSPKEHFYEIISKSDQWFQRRRFFLRICSCPYSESSPHSLQPCLMMDQNFSNNF